MTLLALSLAAAILSAHHGYDAEAQGDLPHIQMPHAGATIESPLVELHASPEPAELELVAHGMGAGAEVSLRVLRAVDWDGSQAPAPPVIADHGAGRVTITVNRSSPGEFLVEVAASGSGGEARGLYTVRAIRTLPPEGSHDRAPPSYIVDSVKPDDPALLRILAQSSLPLCADRLHGSLHPFTYLEWFRNADDWQAFPTLSGAPPIEGMTERNFTFHNQSSNPELGGWRTCNTRAHFGSEVAQWMYVCPVPGSDRTHYYLQRDGDAVSTEELCSTFETEGAGRQRQYPADPYEEPRCRPRESSAVNPHNGIVTNFDYYMAIPHAAAPGSHWFRTDEHYNLGYPPPGLDPYTPEPTHGIAAWNLLYLRNDDEGTIRVAHTVKGSFSFVPELLLFSDKFVVRATAFHSNDIVVRVTKVWDSPVHGIPGSSATVNGTIVPVLAQDDSPVNVRVPVRVSDIALKNGILVKGITDYLGDLPKDRQREALRGMGITTDLDVGGMEVRDLHRVMLVVGIPVKVGNIADYERIDPDLAITPWECWPRINQPISCLTGEWPGPAWWQGFLKHDIVEIRKTEWPKAGKPWWECPPCYSGSAWVP